MHTDPWMPGLRQQRITVDDGVEINAWVGGQGPALLLVHGHPQTSAIWHRVAPRLAQQFTVVLADLRGYGDSSRPAGDPEHVNYSKRTMARDLLRLMARLGHEHFSVLAHDRGARVAHRLAMDYPASVQRLVLLDIAPTLAMYEQTGEAFARAYWHWFFLIQPAPLPERLIEADPAAYVREIMGRRSAGLAPFDPRALAEYQRCLAARTACARTTAPRPASTWTMTARTAGWGAGCPCRCWCSGARRAWCTAASIRCASGSSWPTMCAVGHWPAGTTLPRRRPTHCWTRLCHFCCRPGECGHCWLSGLHSGKPAKKGKEGKGAFAPYLRRHSVLHGFNWYANRVRKR